MTSHEQLSLFPALDFGKYPKLNKAFTSNQIFFLHKLLDDHTQHVMQLVLSELRGTGCDRLSALPPAEEPVDVFTLTEDTDAPEDAAVAPTPNVDTKTIRAFIDFNPALIVSHVGEGEFHVSTLRHVLEQHLPLSESDKAPSEAGKKRSRFACRLDNVLHNSLRAWPNNPCVHKRHGVYTLKPEYIAAAVADITIHDYMAITASPSL